MDPWPTFRNLFDHRRPFGLKGRLVDIFWTPEAVPWLPFCVQRRSLGIFWAPEVATWTHLGVQRHSWGGSEDEGGLPLQVG